VNRHTIILDWDGTMVPGRWPEQVREWCPGAVEAIKRLHATGKFHFKVASARLSPYDPTTFQRRDPSVLAAEVQYIRDHLDSAGLTFVDIWTLEGKPGGDVYVDDKAERYTGRPGSWRALADKILMRFEGMEADFPEFDQEVART
jgi:hypothetical protein